MTGPVYYPPQGTATGSTIVVLSKGVMTQYELYVWQVYQHTSYWSKWATYDSLEAALTIAEIMADQPGMTSFGLKA